MDMNAWDGFSTVELRQKLATLGELIGWGVLTDQLHRASVDLGRDYRVCREEAP